MSTDQQKPKIACLPNGPYYLLNDMTPVPVPNLRRANGETCANVRGVALCRCGQSKKKPYCDSSHTAAGFMASGEPAKQESQALELRNGPMRITPKPNGPLLVSGNLEIVSGTGRTINRVTKTVLCRCGNSANKPYCDGSHTRVGFKSE